MRPTPVDLTIGYHFPLILTVEQAVIILHANELMPAVLLCNILERLEFPRGHLHTD